MTSLVEIGEPPSDVGDAGVVPRAVETLVLADHVRNHVAHGVLIGHIHMYERSRTARLLNELDGFLSTGDVDVGDIHVGCAFAREQQRAGAAHTAAGAGDEYDLPFDHSHSYAAQSRTGPPDISDGEMPR